MGGGSKTQTTTTNATKDPWGPAVPALQNLLTRTGALMDSGVGAQVYQGPRVAGLGEATKAGLGQIEQGAAAGGAVAQSGAGLVNGLMNSGGTTAGTRAATAGLAGIDPTVSTGGVAAAAGKLSDPNSLAATTGASLAGGTYATDTAPVAGLASSLAGGTSQTQRSLQDVADGKYLAAGNPYLDAVISRAQNEGATRVAQSFAANGRYGSGRFAGAQMDAVAGIGAKLRFDDYNLERGRQAEAAQAIDTQGNSRAGLAGSLLGQVAGVNSQNAGIAATGAGLAQGALRDALTGQQSLATLQGSNTDRSLSQAGALLSAAQGDRQAGLAATAMTPMIQQALLTPGETQTKVGATYDAARQDQINADREKFEDEQSLPWRQLGLAGNLVLPIAGLGGTSTGTETRTIPQPSVMQSILGGLSTGVGLLGKTGAFPTAAAGAGSAGWLSALPALFSMSDERLKENVAEVGKTHDGQPLYRYNFKGDPTPQIGLMAQEVAQRDPGAVAQTPDGFLAVDYNRATAPSAGLANAAMAPQAPQAPRPGLADSIMRVESGGNATAKNPNSTATGAGQFIEGTWLDMVGRHRPDLAGMPRDQVLALRNDPTLSREMTQAYAEENGAKLRAAGLPDNDGTRYLSHFAGPAGAKSVLSADPSTPVSAVLTPDAIAANRFLQGKTAGWLTDWAARKVGGDTAMQMPGGSAAPGRFGLAGPTQAGGPATVTPSGGAAMTMPEGPAGDEEMAALLGRLMGGVGQTPAANAPQAPAAASPNRLGLAHAALAAPGPAFDHAAYRALLARSAAR